MSHESQAVYFNAVPLLVLGSAYLLVAATLVPTLWRERNRTTLADAALASVFPGIGIPAIIFGNRSTQIPPSPLFQTIIPSHTPLA